MSALASFESEIRANTPFDMFGLVLPLSDGRMTFELRNESCAAVHVLAIDDIPEPLRREAPAAAQVSDFSALRRPGSVIDRLLAPWPAGALAVVPLPGTGGVLWATSPESRRYTDAELERLAHVAEMLPRESGVGGGDNAPARGDGIGAKLEMVDALVKTLAGVLDVRQVFDRVAEIARKVVPHEALLIREMYAAPARVRNYAFTGFGDLVFPEESPMTQPELLSEPGTIGSSKTFWAINATRS